MLQYEETTETWTEIGKMKKARSWHAIVPVDDVSLFCYGIVGQTNEKRNKLFVGTILIKNGTISMKVGTIAVR